MDAFGDETRARFMFCALAASIGLAGALVDVGDPCLRLACMVVAVGCGGYAARWVRMERIGRRYVADIDAVLAGWDANTAGLDLAGRRRMASHRRHARSVAVSEARDAAAANVLAYEVPPLRLGHCLAFPEHLVRPADVPLKPLPRRKVKLVSRGAFRPAGGFTP